MKTSLSQDIIHELKSDVLADRETCGRIADDFLQLMRTPNEDFRLIKEQSWYKRIWNTFGGQNLQRVASGLHSLAQAQALVTELIKITANNHVNGMQLVQLVAEDLERTKMRQGALVGHLSNIYDEISVLKQQLQYQKTMVLDENELPEEIRILILRAMIVAAHVDKKVDEAETEIISRKIDSMELSEKARRIILSELTAPTPLKLDLRTLDSHKVRFLLYRNVAAVVAADGVIHAKEALLLDRLAKAFGIHKEDAKKVQQELLHLKTTDGLDTLIASVVNSFSKKAAEEEAKAKAEQEEEQARQYEIIVKELADSWMTLIGKLAAFGCKIIQAPLLARLDNYTEESEIIKSLDFLNDTAIRNETMQASDGFCSWLNEGMDEGLIKAFPFIKSRQDLWWSKSVGKRLPSDIANELSTGFRGLVQLSQAEAQVRKSDGGTLSLMAEAGIAGVGLGVLTGGLGILAGGAYGWWKGKKKEEEAAAALEAYQTSLKSFADSFDESIDRVSESLWNVGADYFDRILIPALCDEDVEYESLQDFQKLILQEHGEIERLAESHDVVPSTSWHPISVQTGAPRKITSTPILPNPSTDGKTATCRTCGKEPANNIVWGQTLCDECAEKHGNEF